MFWILLLVIFAALVYWKVKSSQNYWPQRGVKDSTDGSFLGIIWKNFIMRKQTFPEMLQNAYHMYPNARYTGFYQFLNPVLIIRDPDLIKQITVKHFDYFMNHQSFIPEGDLLFSKNLFSLKDEKWRDMRTTMSPAFTSSKMKYMFSLISQNCDQFVKHFLKKEEDVVSVELKDVFTRFTNDVIANVAFGIEVDSLSDVNNEFYLMGKELTGFSSWGKIIRLLGASAVPKLYKIFKISPFPPKPVQFFANTAKNNIEARRKQNIVRPDMINILLESRKKGLKHDETSTKDTGFATVEESESNKTFKVKAEITDLDIIAQAIGFFFAGFETASGIMCFLSYELGANPDIQEKLIREVDQTFESCNGRITYEAILSMKYLDMVVSESLRKWPNVINLDRACSKPYTIEPKYPDEKPLHLEKDACVWLPVFALHRDPEYYPDPERFDPERFNDTNKGKINPYTYLPFGIGPRACLGSRLALLEAKTLFFYILSNFEIVPIEKTQIPLRVCKKQLNMTAEGGFWFGLKNRVKS